MLEYEKTAVKVLAIIIAVALAYIAWILSMH